MKKTTSLQDYKTTSFLGEEGGVRRRDTETPRRQVYESISL